MKKVFIILPINIIQTNLIPNDCDLILIEDPIYFGYRNKKLNFNKLKLVLHRASMKYYHKLLINKGFKVKKYFEFKQKQAANRLLKQYDEIYMFDPVDHLVFNIYKKLLGKKLIVYDSPIFINSLEDLEEYENYRNKKKHTKFYHSSFYAWQRKKLNILSKSKTYDTENRESLPENVKIPNMPKGDQDTNFVKEAIRYINKHFPKNYGDTQYFMYPVTHSTANKWLRNFINNRLHLFGTYQDAISTRDEFLFHSVLSPMINIGLLLPHQVVDEITKAFKDKRKKIKINNYEGFIRQIIGWREYQRYLYE
jgi:deoxyribodipyrimidine photolyase-related protein